MYDYKTGGTRLDTFKDDEDRLGYYDYLCTITYFGLMSQALKTKAPVAIEIEDGSDIEKFVVHISQMTIDGNTRPHVYLKMPFFDFYSFVISEYGFHGLSIFKRYKKGDFINAYDLTLRLSKENDVDPWMFGDIYREYYNKRKEKK